MSTVDEIVAAAQQLSRADFLRLRRRLERLEERPWAGEPERTTADLRRANLTDKEIGRLVMRRRREARR